MIFKRRLGILVRLVNCSIENEAQGLGGSISNSWTPEERQVRIQKFATTGLDYAIQFTNTIASLELLEHASILC